MSVNYVENAIAKTDRLFKEAETAWKEEFVEDALITEDEQKLLRAIEEKPKMLVKWEGRMIEVKKLKGFLKPEADKLYAKLYVDMLKNSEINFTQRELEKQIKANEEYIKILRAIEKCDIIISEIESFLNHLRTLHWDVKNMIEIKKLIYGVTA